MTTTYRNCPDCGLRLGWSEFAAHRYEAHGTSLSGALEAKVQNYLDRHNSKSQETPNQECSSCHGPCRNELACGRRQRAYKQRLGRLPE